jgi:hypothetical protein
VSSTTVTEVTVRIVAPSAVSGSYAVVTFALLATAAISEVACVLVRVPPLAASIRSSVEPSTVASSNVRVTVAASFSP